MGCRKRKDESHNGAYESSAGNIEIQTRKRAKKPVHHSKSFKLIFQLTLTAVFFFVELIVGYIGNSMALVADSFHMLSDVISLIIGLLAVRMASKRSSKNTFGWVRAEVLGALVNSVFLLALCFSIFIESVKRIIEPEPVEDPDLVLYVGIAGLLINVIGMFIFSHHHAHDHGGGGHDHGHGHSHGHGNTHVHNHGHDHGHGEANHHHVHAHTHQSHDHKLTKPLKTGNVGDHSDGDSEQSETLITSHGDKSAIDSEFMTGKSNATNCTSSSSTTVNSRSTLNPKDYDHLPTDSESGDTRPVNIMNPQLTAPSFTCYFCRNCIPAASRSKCQPESCFKCAENQVPSAITYPLEVTKKVNMNGIKKDEEKQQSCAKKKQNPDQMNIRGVFLHILGDFLGSIIVCITAGTLMLCERLQFCGPVCDNQPTGTRVEVPCWTFYLDPCLSICMVIIILSSTIPLLKESAFILLQTVPTHIRIDQVQSELLEQVPSIKGMHELHVWQLAGNRIIASAHVQCQSPQEYMQMANDIKRYFHDMGIHSTTIQPEFIETPWDPKNGMTMKVPIIGRTDVTHDSQGSVSVVGSSGSNSKESKSVVRSDGGDNYENAADNKECLLTCGPEKSCTDELLCCPRDRADPKRISKKRISEQEQGGNATGKLLTDVSLDLTGISNQGSHLSAADPRKPNEQQSFAIANFQSGGNSRGSNSNSEASRGKQQTISISQSHSSNVNNESRS